MKRQETLRQVRKIKKAREERDNPKLSGSEKSNASSFITEEHSSDESGSSNASILKRRIESHLEKYRYKTVEARYLSQINKPTKDLDDYFINL